MGQIKGRWLISDEDYPEFLDHLDDYLNVKKGRCLNFVEQPRLDSPKPLLIDLDFRFPVGSTLNHRFGDKECREFVREVCGVLDTFFDTNRYSALRFFVSLRPTAYPDGNKSVKDGVHIQCPDISLSNAKQKVLRQRILEQGVIQRVFGETGFTNLPEDIYDESMVRKQGWFFYGESKPKINPYALSNIFSYDPERQILDESDPASFTNRELMEILSVRYQVEEDDNEVRPEQRETFAKMLKSGIGRPTLPATAGPAPVGGGEAAAHLEAGEGGGAGAADVQVYIPDSYDGEEIELAKRITLECLSETRADTYKTWIETGWCLYNIEPTAEMFQTWVEFSKKSPKCEGTDWSRLEREWNRGFSRNTPGAKLTLKSLHYWARDDNPEKYKELIEEDNVRFVQYRTDDTHFHVAKLLHKMYKGLYCASVEQRSTRWYRYDPKLNSWRMTNQGIELMEKLSTEVADLVVRAKQRLKKEAWDKHCASQVTAGAGALPDEDWFKNWAVTADGQRFAMLAKLEKHLYQQDFKGGVMRAAVELFYEEDFTNCLNMNQYLFACKNGVLDLNCSVRNPETGEMEKKVVFRPGRPDDFMSFLAGRNYPDSEPLEYHPYDPEDPKQQELQDFLKKIFVTDDLRTYFIRLMASCLEGANREQCYYTFIGIGGNGKSKVVDLMRYTWGDYCSSLSATALTRKRPDSGAANPDIIAIKNKRFIYLQEPDDREPLNTSRMKQFSGEDVVEARGLFEDQQRFRITGKLFMMCNRYPPIHAMDRGTWRRIRSLLFGSKFVDPSDPDLKNGRPNVFLRDNHLDEKLRTWREAWLALLVHVYEKEYMVRGLEPIPQAILDESNKYKESFDQYGKFKAERMIDFRNARLGLEERGNEQVTLKDVQLAYNNWTRQNEGTLVGKRLTKQELQIRLEEDFGNLDNGVYKRCVVFFDDEGREEFITNRKPEPEEE